MSKTIAIVVGETSGDILGADLIRHLRAIWPTATFLGVGGPRMIAEGFQSLHDMERLAVMGLVEPLKRLPELLSIRKDLVTRFTHEQPDVFIGIDAPDFNTTVELRLRRAGVKTVHYVSPSVWAWRRGRIKKIKKAVDHMLTLLPFEAAFYVENEVPVTFVGHPLAYELKPLDKTKSAEKLSLCGDKKRLAIMPGSRGSEIKLMAHVLLQTGAQLIADGRFDEIIIPAANAERQAQLVAILKGYPDLPVTVVLQQSRIAMAASDAVLLTSGTTALEAMLLGKPMVVAYKLSGLSYSILKYLVRTPFMSIPNLLAKHELVPEFLQDAVTVDNLTRAMDQVMDKSDLLTDYQVLANQLRAGGGEKAAAAVKNVCTH